MDKFLVKVVIVSFLDRYENVRKKISLKVKAFERQRNVMIRKVKEASRQYI